MSPLFVKVLLITIGIFSLVVLGGFLRKSQVVNHRAKNSLLTLLINVFLPCLIFSEIALKPSLHASFFTIISPLFWGFCIVSLGMLGIFVLASLKPKLFGLENFASQRSFSFAIGLQNYGFLALPLAEGLFPNQGISAAVLIHNVGVELAIWTIGVAILSGSKEHLGWSKLINAPSIAIVVSLIYQYTMSDVIAKELWTGVQLLGAMAIPVGLLSAGFTIAEKLKGHRFFHPNSLKKAGWAIFFRLGLIPLFIFGAMLWLDPSDIIKKVLIIQLAMPAGVSPIYLSDYYKADASTAFNVAFFTTLFGLLTIGLWLVGTIQYFGF